MESLDLYRTEAAAAASELAELANLRPGQIVVVGCSTSEITGHKIGTDSAPEIGQALFEGIQSALVPRGIRLAAQCCEHLNRAIILEAAALPAGAEQVNVVPQPKAGGSFATAAYRGFLHPVVLEHIRADAGLDIGCTMIGMHLKEVAVPVRLMHDHIGMATVTAAHVRPKFIGGSRAVYDDALK
mgnify:CR=1 FL=1